jgi:hypothetical protein
MDKINVYAINLVKRTDRKASILSEFADKEEFQLTIVPAIEHTVGAVGLWNTICGIVERSGEEDLDYVIICQDDHTFTSHYPVISLQKAIADAILFQADVLLGGVSWFTTCIPVGKNLNWVEKFSGLQFAVVFKKFYTKILNANFQHGNAADYKMSLLSDQIYFIYPFISIQKDFGYSDVTIKNNEKNRVGELFKDADNLVKATKQVISFYKKNIDVKVGPEALTDFDNMSVTTYILNSENSQRRSSRVHSQFGGRTEFDVRMTRMCEHTNNVQAYWMTLNRIVKHATDEGDDVIIVCDDDHLFTESYSRECLIRHIVEGHQLGTRILCGAVDDFETAIPLTRDKFWVRTFRSSSFIVLYQSVFDRILKEPLCNDSTIESLYREITSNKLVMFPFISKREVSIRFNSKRTYPSHGNISSRLAKISQIAESSDEAFGS